MLLILLIQYIALIIKFEKKTSQKFIEFVAISVEKY